MILSIKENKLIVTNAHPDFGNYFIYKTSYSYFDLNTGRPSVEVIERVAFTPTQDGWEFPTSQWIYSVMSAAQEFGEKLENPEILLNFKNPNGLIKDPYHLWGNQIDCLNKMTSYKHGIGILRTGAGKTTMISVLAKNLLDAGKKVIVMAPTNAVLHEIRDRFTSDFDIDCKYYFDPDKNIQFLNPKGFFKSKEFWHKDKYWRDIDCIIMDEVENCMNEKFLRVLEKIPAVKNMYGFSGTAHKVKGTEVVFKKAENMSDNEINLISQLGLTSWYEKPEDIKLNIIKIQPNLVFDKFENTDEMFNQVQVSFAGNEQLHEIIEKLFTLGTFKNLFIPFTSRVAIAKFLETSKRPIGMITGSGCQYRLIPGTELINCDLPFLKSLMKEEKIEIALSSVSGFAGVDYPDNWDSSLANSIGNNANRLVQAAGRVARAKNKEFNYIYIPSKGTVPVYTKQLKTGVKLMSEYYSQGKVTHSVIKL